MVSNPVEAEKQIGDPSEGTVCSKNIQKVAMNDSNTAGEEGEMCSLVLTEEAVSANCTTEEEGKMCSTVPMDAVTANGTIIHKEGEMCSTTMLMDVATANANVQDEGKMCLGKGTKGAMDGQDTALEDSRPISTKGPPRKTGLHVFSMNIRCIFKLDELGLEIARIAIPAALALAADPLASLVDTAFVGRLEFSYDGSSISILDLEVPRCSCSSLIFGHARCFLRI